MHTYQQHDISLGASYFSNAWTSANSRGQDAIGVFEAYGFSMTGLKILDVGCAYGGFSIEAARKGACCYGVEISNALYELATLNNKGEAYDEGYPAFREGIF